MGLEKERIMNKVNVNLTKESFCGLIDEIENHYRNIEEIEDIIGINLVEAKTFDLFDKIINFLTDLFYTEEELKECDGFDDISYYMWKLNFGKNWRLGTVTDVNGKDIPLKNSEDLWNILTEKGE